MSKFYALRTSKDFFRQHSTKANIYGKIPTMCNTYPKCLNGINNSATFEFFNKLCNSFHVEAYRR